jgi:hypothetical protein
MTIKQQFTRIKENWLLFGLVVIVLGVFLTGSGGVGSLTQKSFGSFDGIAESRVAIARDYGDFAPEIEERKITKSANLQSEVKRGEFNTAEVKFKGIVTTVDGIILNENLNTYNDVVTGSYTIKVDERKYAAVISQLKEIGKVTSFSENAADITGSYVNAQLNLESEKSRLVRYKELYRDSTRIEDKLQLTDRIFNQERTIKYLEESLKNKDRQVEYSTISFTMREEESAWRNIAVVKFSQLIKDLVSSINSVLSLVFWAIPYALVAGLIWFVVRLVRK